MSINMNRSEYVEIDDNIFLHIRDWGQGTTIVFVPGWPLGHEMFEYQFTQLPQPRLPLYRNQHARFR